MRPTELLSPTYLQMLTALSNWLDKAGQQLPSDEANALLCSRLAPDMFPLSTQIRFVCAQAQEGMFRLKGQEFPPSLEALLEEGRAAGEKPGTLAEAQARIDETVALVRSLSATNVQEDFKRPIAHTLPNGMTFDFTVAQYARDWALPQFYFHLMIAYAILRAGGVNLGKVDYVAHLFSYLRPGTMPA